MNKNLLKLSLILVFLQTTLLVECWPTFQLYTKSNPNNPELVDKNSINASSRLNNSLETKFLVHGFNDNGNITLLRQVKDNLLKLENVNAIIVDWSQGAAGPIYYQAAQNTKVTGKAISEFIKNKNLDPKLIHCIGHSLGSHVCGFTSKIIKLRRISGLDPAGPFFKGSAAKKRLDQSDADLVDCIHTSKIYGIQDSICQKNYYPNGGAAQPGCGQEVDIFKNLANGLVTDFRSLAQLRFSLPHSSLSKAVKELSNVDFAEVIACGHLRAVKLYAESVNSTSKFSAVPCSDYTKYKTNKSCSCKNDCPSMGYYSDKYDDQGKFFLDTNSASPYSLN